MTGFADAAATVDVAVIVVTYNSAAELPAFLGSLAAETSASSIRLVVVDNDSTDATVDIAGSYENVIVARSGGNLGYAGGINAGRGHVGKCDAVLVLNPDLTVTPGSVAVMLDAASRTHVGAVAPLLLDEQRTIYPSLRNEPSLLAAFGDAVVGGRVKNRPASMSMMVLDDDEYSYGHRIDWATGAALLVRRDVWDLVGEWDERYFLYSEEVDYCRRIRSEGFIVWFEPSASVCHTGAGSGSSVDLDALMAVNTIRYVENYHGSLYSNAFRGIVGLSEALRAYDSAHRRVLRAVVSRSSWSDLPRATASAPAFSAVGGAVVIPAYNEATVIRRTLEPLVPLTVDGNIEVIVVCNGCTDNTADVARTVTGITVLDIDVPSKIAALNAGDAAASNWPRVYLDADVAASPKAIIDTLAVLGSNVTAARPVSRYDTSHSSTLVRSYYRARARVSFDSVLWGAGCYGLGIEGHRRLGKFPDVIADDVHVDELFDAREKRVIDTEPVIVRAPLDTRSLLAILSRNYRGNQQAGSSHATSTVRELVGTIRGPVTAFDTAVYVGFALLGRRRARTSQNGWLRDESTR